MQRYYTDVDIDRSQNMKNMWRVFFSAALCIASGPSFSQIGNGGSRNYIDANGNGVDDGVEAAIESSYEGDLYKKVRRYFLMAENAQTKMNAYAEHLPAAGAMIAQHKLAWLGYLECAAGELVSVSDPTDIKSSFERLSRFRSTVAAKEAEIIGWEAAGARAESLMLAEPSFELDAKALAPSSHC